MKQFIKVYSSLVSDIVMLICLTSSSDKKSIDQTKNLSNRVLSPDGQKVAKRSGYIPPWKVYF